MTPSDVESRLVDSLLAASTLSLSADVPAGIQERLPIADETIEKVAAIYGEAAKGDYFASSKLRYRQYFAAVATLPPGSSILEVGSAPGHVSIGMHLLGMKVTGINLNELYRPFYPSPDWLALLNVTEHDFEKEPLPFTDGSFDAALFTEVLEHIAITDPVKVLADIRRTLKPGGTFIMSTPNVCNLSNIGALIAGENIFWSPEMFYGSLDRHNREFTPAEVSGALSRAGFGAIELYGFSCHSNWRAGGVELAYRAVARCGETHPLLLNTTMAIARNPG